MGSPRATPHRWDQWALPVNPRRFWLCCFACPKRWRTPNLMSRKRQRQKRWRSWHQPSRSLCPKKIEWNATRWRYPFQTCGSCVKWVWKSISQRSEKDPGYNIDSKQNRLGLHRTRASRSIFSQVQETAVPVSGETKTEPAHTKPEETQSKVMDQIPSQEDTGWKLQTTAQYL